MNNEVTLRRKRIIDVLKVEIEQLSSERQLDLVLDKSQVLYANKATDLTDEVLKRVNQQMKSQ